MYACARALVCALDFPLALGFQWGLWRFRHRGVLLMNEPIFEYISARALYGWAGADLRAHIASQGDIMHISRKKRVDRHDGSNSLLPKERQHLF